MRLVEQIAVELRDLVASRKRLVRFLETIDVIFSNILPDFVRAGENKLEHLVTLAEEYYRLLEAAKQFPELKELVERSRWENR